MIVAKFLNYEIHKVDDRNFELWVLRYTKKDKTVNFPNSDPVFIPAGSVIKPSSNEWGRFGYTHSTLRACIAHAHAKNGGEA